MTFSKRTVSVAVLSALFVSASVTMPSASAQLQNNVSAATHLASDLGPVDASQPINITVHLKPQNEALFQKTVDALYDPSSPTYHQWLSNEDLKKFAPPQAQLQAVTKELQSQGLTILSTDENGFSIRASGVAANVEQAFHTQIHQFQHNGKVFRANVQNVQLSGAAGSYVASVSGIESHTVRPLATRAINLQTKEPLPSVALTKVQASGGLSSIITNQILSAPTTFTFNSPGASLPIGIYYGNVYGANPNLTPDYTPAQLQQIYGLTAAYKQGLNGTGQTIVLLEAYGYPTIEQDANAFFKLAGLPLLNSSNFEIVYPEGQPVSSQAGILTGWNTEIAIDVQWAHSIAPGAKIVVVAAAGQDSEDFQDAISYITNHNLGNSVSDSWEEDTDLIAGPLEQTSFDQVLERAAAKGISFQFSTGDGGDGGLGTPLGAPGVPSDSPHATAVGGTAILNIVGGTGTEPVGWGDTVTYVSAGGVLDPPEVLGLVGGSGGGESLFFSKPSWQKSLPGTGRQTPDVSALADPYTGVPIVITSGSQQVVEAGWGGTSLASPIFTAIWAIANQKAGHALGQAAPAIAALKEGSVQDVLPLSSPTDVSGIIVDKSGSNYYSPASLFEGALYSTTGFTSAIWNLGSSEYVDFGFGIDSSLTVTPGWDDVTGFGTPNGLTFINAVAAEK
ncbi:subtilase family serine protease [Silvibacterium bohemicum]|uniref:Subtilase family serine protease n=1 Tax=Silvibacterium bohemicum TaxID=1577686 RepID=A0A841JX83_9BACT|nr:S53 family peptidase [Silvibacterium bohemicum]MBB6145047.1 subtilase family serine protease [Silvibacterium bohemicum]